MKQIFIAIGSFLTILLIGYLFLIYSDSTDAIHVDGKDAVKIAWAHPGYIFAVCLGALVSIATFFFAWKKDFYGPKLFFTCLGAGLFMALMLFYKPVNIKTDPKSAGITTEEINYLKSKGLK